MPPKMSFTIVLITKTTMHLIPLYEDRRSLDLMASWAAMRVIPNMAYWTTIWCGKKYIFKSQDIAIQRLSFLVSRYPLVERSGSSSLWRWLSNFPTSMGEVMSFEVHTLYK
jgi:hypothetical protein